MHVGANLPLSDSLVLSPSLSYTYATRKNADGWALATRPTVAFNPAAPLCAAAGRVRADGFQQL